MRNVALHIKYDGTRYHGWQTQKSVETVQQTLETALERLCGHSVKLSGCGRTDAGVHALRYCANFRTESGIPVQRLPLAVNSLLPPDIAVLGAVYAPEEFDANLSCIKKEYAYRIVSSRIRDPFLVSRAYFYPRGLDVEAMRRAAAHFVGMHDFAAMRSVGSQTKTTIRTVHWYEIEQRGDMIELRVCADGFLYNMARAMAGTLIYVSEGKLTPDDIPGLLERKDRCASGPTVPPQGLYLNRIWYDGDVGQMMGE